MSIAPHSKLKKGKNRNTKIKCDGCGRLMRTRGIVQLNGKFLCFNCRRKLDNSRIQESIIQKINSDRRLNLEKALEKTYELNGYLNKDGVIRCFRSFPTVLIGHKVKLQLVK